MRLLITGRPKKIPLKSVRECSNFFAGHLFSNRIQKRLSIRIVFIEGLFAETKNWGDCGPESQDVESKPREFIIRIDPSQSVRSIIKTIAHEFTHAAQYASGKMKDYVREDVTKFHEGFYKTTDDTDEEYLLKPWEIEAVGYENNLYRAFQIYKERMKKK